MTEGAGAPPELGDTARGSRRGLQGLLLGAERPRPGPAQASVRSRTETPSLSPEQ